MSPSFYRPESSAKGGAPRAFESTATNSPDQTHQERAGLRMYLNGFRAECLGSNLGRGLGYRVSGHYPDHGEPKNKIIWKLGRYSVVGEVVG